MLHEAGRTAGMLTVSVPTALAGRFKLPSAQLSFDGFGPGKMGMMNHAWHMHKALSQCIS